MSGLQQLFTSIENLHENLIDLDNFLKKRNKYLILLDDLKDKNDKKSTDIKNFISTELMAVYDLDSCMLSMQQFYSVSQSFMQFASSTFAGYSSVLNLPSSMSNYNEDYRTSEKILAITEYLTTNGVSRSDFYYNTIQKLEYIVSILNQFNRVIENFRFGLSEFGIRGEFKMNLPPFTADKVYGENIKMLVSQIGYIEGCTQFLNSFNQGDQKYHPYRQQTIGGRVVKKRKSRNSKKSKKNKKYSRKYHK